MRLPALAHGQTRFARFFLKAMERSSGRTPPDVVKMLVYRPRFFGNPFSNALDAVMRGESEWSLGERELFAAYTSRLNQCVF